MQTESAENVEWMVNAVTKIIPVIKAVAEIVHIADTEFCIIEVDFFHPELCRVFSNATVKSVFIMESDTEQLIQNFLNREGTRQAYRAEISCAHSRLLANLCVKYGVPTVEARPWNSLMERVIAALE